MPAIQTTRRLLTAYTDRGRWRTNDEAQSRLDVEERLTWGVHIFKGLLDLEARTQAHALKKAKPEAELLLLEMMPLFYQVWIEASEFYLKQAQDFLIQGCDVQGLEQLQETIEEARCLISNLELEEQIRPIEELMGRSRPENPRPDRYGD